MDSKDQHERDSRTPVRPWGQFGVKTLLALFAAMALLLGIWRWHAERQRRAVAAIEAVGGRAYYPGEAQSETASTVRWLPRDWDLGVTLIKLNGPRATDAVLPHLSSLPDLRVVYLHEANVTDDGLRHLADLQRLRILDLRRTGVTDNGLQHLLGLSGLRSLDLRHTDVSDAGVMHLREMTGLGSLDLRHTRVTMAAVAELHVALPDCEIGPEGLAQR